MRTHSRIHLYRRLTHARDGRGMTALVAIGLILAWAGPSSAQQEKTQAGWVVDESYAQVGQAKVWAIGGSIEEPRTIAEATANGHGTFVLHFQPDPKSDGPGQPASQRATASYDLVARAPDGRFGWLNRRFSPEKPGPVVLMVAEKADTRGRLVDHESRPIAGALMVPAYMNRLPDGVLFGAFSAPLPRAIAEQLQTTTAADGTFLLTGLPRGHEVGARIIAPGFGTPILCWTVSKPINLTLDSRLGRIEGHIKMPDKRGLDGATRVTLLLVGDLREQIPRGFGLRYSRSSPVKPDCSFEFDALPPGQYQLTPDLTVDSQFLAQPLRKIVVGPGAKVGDLEIPLVPTVTITGRVVDAETGTGIAGVGIHCNPVDWKTRFVPAPHAETDGEGRYRIRVPRGKMQVAPNKIPATHLGLRRPDYPQLDVDTDVTCPDLKLPRAAILEGVVVDSNGHPVSAALVWSWDRADSTSGLSRSMITLKNGNFRLEQLAPDHLVTVCAKREAATTNGSISVRPKDQKGKLTLTVDSKFASRIRATVTDAAGKPLAGLTGELARIEEPTREGDPRLRSIGREEMIRSTASGGLESSALCPGFGYTFRIIAEGYDLFDSPVVIAEAGKVHDLGTIKLVPKVAGNNPPGR
jgi:hypothetical protein